MASGVWLGLKTCHSSQRKTAPEQGVSQRESIVDTKLFKNNENGDTKKHIEKRDVLLMLLVIPNGIGQIFTIGRILLVYIGVLETTKSSNNLLLSLTLSVSMLIILWGLWKYKRWAAVAFLIFLIGFTIYLGLDNSFSNVGLLETGITLVLAVGVWWLFVGRLWNSFQ